MINNPEVQNLLGQFVELEGASQVYGLITHNKSQAEDSLGKNDHSFSSLVAGYLFELFGYDYQKRNLKENHTLLTPRQTLNLYSETTKLPKAVYQTGRSLLDIGLQGVSVPDGIEIENPTRMIIRLHEYKTSQRLNETLEQMNRFRDFKTVQNNLDVFNEYGRVKTGRIFGSLLRNQDSRPIDLSPNYGLNYSVPENSVLQGIALPEGVTVDYLPINTYIFAEFIDAVIKGCLRKDLHPSASTKVLPASRFTS